MSFHYSRNELLSLCIKENRFFCPSLATFFKFSFFIVIFFLRFLQECSFSETGPALETLKKTFFTSFYKLQIAINRNWIFENLLEALEFFSKPHQKNIYLSQRYNKHDTRNQHDERKQQREHRKHYQRIPHGQAPDVDELVRDNIIPIMRRPRRRHRQAVQIENGRAGRKYRQALKTNIVNTNATQQRTQLTTAYIPVINAARCMSRNTAFCTNGRWYHGTFNDFILRLVLRFADDLVVTCEYTDGVPTLGDFFPYIS